jgi:hypothetical protein
MMQSAYELFFDMQTARNAHCSLLHSVISCPEADGRARNEREILFNSAANLAISSSLPLVEKTGCYKITYRLSSAHRHGEEVRQSHLSYAEISSRKDARNAHCSLLHSVISCPEADEREILFSSAAKLATSSSLPLVEKTGCYKITYRLLLLSTHLIRKLTYEVITHSILIIIQ